MKRFLLFLILPFLLSAQEVIQVDTVADLVALNPKLAGRVDGGGALKSEVSVRRHSTSVDVGFGAGVYSYSASLPSDLTTNMSGAVFAATEGYWIRKHNGAIPLSAFGAIADNSTDNKSAFEAAAAWSKATGGKIIGEGAPLPYVLSSINVTEMTMEGTSATHTSTNYSYAGFMIRHAAGATNHMINIVADEGSSFSKGVTLKRVVLIGRRESNLRDPCIITNVVSRTSFSVMSGWPTADGDSDYATSPFYNLGFIFSPDGQYHGSVQVSAINQSTGELTIGAFTDLYDTETNTTTLGNGWKICFSKHTEETGNIGASFSAHGWDVSNAGYAAINLTGTQTYNKFEDIFAIGWHVAVRKGVNAFSHIDGLHVRGCTLGAYWTAFPGYGSDDSIGNLVVAGIYTTEKEDGDTSAEDEPAIYKNTYNRSYCGFRIGSSAITMANAIIFDCVRNAMFAAGATEVQAISMTLDRSVLQSLFLEGGGNVVINNAAIRGVAAGFATNQTDCIAVSSGRLGIDTLTTSPQADPSGSIGIARNVVRISGSSGRVKVKNWIDTGGVGTGFQSTGDAARAVCDNYPWRIAASASGSSKPTEVNEGWIDTTTSGAFKMFRSVGTNAGDFYRVLATPAGTTLTASRALVLDSNGIPSTSTATGTEVAYLSGVTATVSDVQTSSALSYSGGTNITVTVPTTGAPHVVNTLATTADTYVTFSGSNAKATGELILSVSGGPHDLSFAGNVLKPASTTIPLSLTDGTWNLEWKQRSIGGTNFTVLNVLEYDTP